jgi:hypothetical protein
MYAESLQGPWFFDEQLVFNCSLQVAGSSSPLSLHARQRPTLLWHQSSRCPYLFTGASSDPVSQYYSSFSMMQATKC